MTDQIDQVEDRQEHTAMAGDVESYIEDCLTELTNMALAARLEFLAYLLRMATAEAKNSQAVTPSGQERLHG